MMLEQGTVKMSCRHSAAMGETACLKKKKKVVADARPHSKAELRTWILLVDASSPVFQSGAQFPEAIVSPRD